MGHKKLHIKLWKKIQRLPREITISVGVLTLLSALYGLIFFTEKSVVFSYAGPTCVRQLTLFPGLHKNTDQSQYVAYASDGWRLGDVTVAAFSMCFKPKEPPLEGAAVVSAAPFGGQIARKTFRLEVAPHPVAYISDLTKPVPISKPLDVRLSQTDKVFEYTMKMGKGQAMCHPDEDEAKVACDLQPLGLVQGKTYDAQLERYFQGKKVDTVAQKKLTILSATKVTKSSIKAGETVYAKPKTIDLIFDKKITQAASKLYHLDGKKRTEIPTTIKPTTKGVRITIAKHLPRSATYQLAVDGVQASDGSSLEEPYKLAFKTSGGPKVTGVNVGGSGISLGTTMVITFDQPLFVKQDIKKIVTATGGAVVSGKQANQISIPLGGVPKCGDFTIKITNNLQSKYGVTGGSAWSFTGRMICYTISTIGYSVHGQPINAYFFGNGSRTVLYTGAIHGNEYSTASLMERWIQELDANARKIPGNKSIVVVPRINPDGASAGSRTNAHNVDLNRNFGTSDWKKDITNVYNQPFKGGGGKSPMSEPETNAIASLASQLRPIVILSYHSIGGVVAANQAGGSNSYASTYSRLSGYRDTTGQTSETFEYSVSGTADDWYAEKLGVASVLIELGSHSYHQFERNQSAMWAMVNV